MKNDKALLIIGGLGVLAALSGRKARAAFEVQPPVTNEQVEIQGPVTLGTGEGAAPGEGLLPKSSQPAVEETAPAPVYSTLVAGPIEIRSINGIPFISAVPGHATMAEPIKVADLNGSGFIVLEWRNISLPIYNPDNFTELQFRVQFEPEFAATGPYSYNPPQQYARMDLPKGLGGVYRTTFHRWYSGDFLWGIYSGSFKMGTRYFDQAFASMGNPFTIRNMIQSVGSGSAPPE